ncbi:MAG: shikimate dehydrogenase [Chloroflexota bacterium]|nr:MAG: shikimate dehydrogenase [Chloroflexota bacterium]
MLQHLFLLGHPLGHSVSPAFQQAALDHAGISARYEPADVPPQDLPTAVARLRQPDVLGANVTVPYKEAVMPLLDEIDGRARAIGAVNTIVRRGRRLQGYNTDADGFVQGLRERTGFELGGQRVVMLGAGGAARAVAFAALESGVASLTIFNRDLERARRLLNDLEQVTSVGPGIARAMLLDTKSLAGAVVETDLLVNATPVGMYHTASEGTSPAEGIVLPASMLVYDLIYNPRQTRLLLDAAAAGARTLDGLAMLVHQGAEAFALWTGRQPNLEAMFRAAEAALAGKKG